MDVGLTLLLEVEELRDGLPDARHHRVLMPLHAVEPRFGHEHWNGNELMSQ